MVTSSFLTTVPAMACPLSSVLQQLSEIERDDAIRRLSGCFQWSEYEGDAQRQNIHQEFVYENVMCSVKRGLPWTAVAQIANLSKELLPELRGLSKSEAIFLIQRRLMQCEPRLALVHQAALLDFMVGVYGHHHQLYQAFLKGEANLKGKHCHLEVDVPPSPLPLCEGTDVVLWEKQQALKKLIEAEKLKQAELNRLQEQAEAQLMTELQVSELAMEGKLDRQAVESIGRSFLQPLGEVIKKILMEEIQVLQEVLELRLNQTTLL